MSIIVQSVKLSGLTVNPDGVVSGARPFYFVVSDYPCGAVTGPWSWSMYPRARAQRDSAPAGFVSYQS
jgi:hypothetical protein